MQGSPMTEQLQERTSQIIVKRIAEREGTTPAELTPPLYTAIDADALDRLLDSLDESYSAGQIEFTYCGYQIRVHGDGTVDIAD